MEPSSYQQHQQSSYSVTETLETAWRAAAGHLMSTGDPEIWGHTLIVHPNGLLHIYIHIYIYVRIYLLPSDLIAATSSLNWNIESF